MVCHQINGSGERTGSEVMPQHHGRLQIGQGVRPRIRIAGRWPFLLREWV